MTPRTPRALRAVAATALVVAATASCAWRVETPPIERRTPTAEVMIRDQAAAREQAVIDAAGEGLLADIQAATAPVRLDALGGVYVATPGPTPSPEPSATAATLAEASRAALDGALTDAVAADGASPSLAALLRSIALSHAVALAAPGAAGAAPAARIVPATAAVNDALLPPTDSTVAPDTLATLAVAHDEAGFAYEVAAARATGDERTFALERARLHRERAAGLVELPGVDDERSALYDVSPELVATAAARADLERSLESALGWEYAALLATVGARDASWLLNAAFDAYAQEASLPGFEAGDVPALPGLTVTAA